MNIVGRWNKRLAGALCAACLASPAMADTLLDTGAPQSGFFGFWGYDVFVGQSVAIAFTPTANYALDDISLWLMSNDFDAPGRRLTVSLQTDIGGSAVPAAPSGTVLETWAHATSAVGWQPVLETLTSQTHVRLNAGQTYWIVAESNEPAFVDPVWTIASNGGQYYIGNIDFSSSPNWQVALGSAAPGALVNATLVPEPGTVALALLGAPLVIGLARRRAKAAPTAVA